MTENSDLYNDIEYLNNESDNDEESESRLTENRHKKIVTPAQVKTLISAMDGRSNNISKGKMKSDPRTKELLEKWEELSEILNKLGPPYHQSTKWRRIWTKVKSNRKRRLGSGTKKLNCE